MLRARSRSVVSDPTTEKDADEADSESDDADSDSTIERVWERVRARVWESDLKNDLENDFKSDLKNSRSSSSSCFSDIFDSMNLTDRTWSDLSRWTNADTDKNERDRKFDKMNLIDRDQDLSQWDKVIW
jgi:hypothetical protein